MGSRMAGSRFSWLYWYLYYTTLDVIYPVPLLEFIELWCQGRNLLLELDLLGMELSLPVPDDQLELLIRCA
jgi:hypothetical protein